MAAVFKSFLAAVALCALAAALPAAEAATRDGSLVLLNFAKERPTPESVAKDFVERLRNAADWAVPRGVANNPVECKVEFSKDLKAKRFSSYTLLGRGSRIVVGGPLESFVDDIDTLSKIEAVMLLARCGLPAERLDDGFPEWLVAGLVRKARYELRISAKLGFAEYPGALALAGAGELPSLRSTLASPLSPEDGACYEIYSEYAQILVVACGRSGMPRDGVFQKAVVDACGGKQAPGRYSSFVGAAASSLMARRAGAPAAQGEALSADVEKWHSQELRRALHSCFFPLPARRVETLFKEACKIRYFDKTKKERVCALDELCSQWDSIADRRLTVSQFQARLVDIANGAPDGVQDCFWKLDAALNQLVAVDAKPSADALSPILKSVYAALESRIAEEAALRRVEKSFYPASVRFHGELSALAILDAWEELPYSKESDYLDSFIAKSAKEAR